MNESSRVPRYLWMLSLGAALLFLVVDSWVRLRGIDALTATTIGSPRALARDPATQSGYEGNQHNLVLPGDGTDGYHWMMQTQQMLARGTGRVRWVDYDGPLQGRAVHWSSPLHWWAALLAWPVSKIRGVPASIAVEQVSPWVNTAFLALLLIVLVPIVARRLGALPASLLALGSVAIYPAYSLYAVGNFDHHGLASSAVMLCVLFLVCGGAGWVRTSDTHGGAARQWFIASGVVGGAGLWISAATQIPALFCIGAAALVSATLPGSQDSSGDGGATGWRAEPQLWRTWGIAGATSSIFFYLLEYFPHHMGMRLEVNHPLYALAWFGAGDLLYRLCQFIGGARSARDTRAYAAGWIALDVALLMLAPAVMWLAPQSFVLRPGSLVMVLHQDYILEFQSLSRQLAHWPLSEIYTEVGILPLVVLCPAALLATHERIASPRRAMAIISIAPALGFSALALWQTRWIGSAYTLWLGGVAAVASIAVTGAGDAWATATVRKVLVGSGVCLGLAFAPFPFVSAYRWLTTNWVYPSNPDDYTQVVARDVSRKLRSRLGTERGMIASGPTTTTWMVYFGGFRGVGTLYWENHDGLAASARLFGATAPAPGRPASDSAYAFIRQLGVTHIVLYSWNAFTDEYARLARGDKGEPDTARAAFGQQLVRGSFPVWLRPLAYRVPPIPGYDSPWALVLEVAPNQSSQEAATRFAQYSVAMGDEATAVHQIDVALTASPDYTPALVTLARLQYRNAKRGDFRATLQRVRAARGRDSLTLEDNIGLALLYMQMGDTASTRPIVERAVEQADERGIRDLPWDHSTENFVVLARQFNLARSHPAIMNFAFTMLDSAAQMRLSSPPQ